MRSWNLLPSCGTAFLRNKASKFTFFFQHGAHELRKPPGVTIQKSLKPDESSAPSLPPLCAELHVEAQRAPVPFCHRDANQYADTECATNFLSDNRFVERGNMEPIRYSSEHQCSQKKVTYTFDTLTDRSEAKSSNHSVPEMALASNDLHRSWLERVKSNEENNMRPLRLSCSNDIQTPYLGKQSVDTNPLTSVDYSNCHQHKRCDAAQDATLLSNDSRQNNEMGQSSAIFRLKVANETPSVNEEEEEEEEDVNMQVSNISSLLRTTPKPYAPTETVKLSFPARGEPKRHEQIHKVGSLVSSFGTTVLSEQEEPLCSTKQQNQRTGIYQSEKCDDSSNPGIFAARSSCNSEASNTYHPNVRLCWPSPTMLSEDNVIEQGNSTSLLCSKTVPCHHSQTQTSFSERVDKNYSISDFAPPSDRTILSHGEPETKHVRPLNATFPSRLQATRSSLDFTMSAHDVFQAPRAELCGNNIATQINTPEEGKISAKTESNVLSDSSSRFRTASQPARDPSPRTAYALQLFNVASYPGCHLTQPSNHTQFQNNDVSKLSSAQHWAQRSFQRCTINTSELLSDSATKGNAPQDVSSIDNNRILNSDHATTSQSENTGLRSTLSDTGVSWYPTQNVSSNVDKSLFGLLQLKNGKQCGSDTTASIYTIQGVCNEADTLNEENSIQSFLTLQSCDKEGLSSAQSQSSMECPSRRGSLVYTVDNPTLEDLLAPQMTSAKTSQSDICWPLQNDTARPYDLYNHFYGSLSDGALLTSHEGLLDDPSFSQHSCKTDIKQQFWASRTLPPLPCFNCDSPLETLDAHRNGPSGTNERCDTQQTQSSLNSKQMASNGKPENNSIPQSSLCFSVRKSDTNVQLLRPPLPQHSLTALRDRPTTLLDDELQHPWLKRISPAHHRVAFHNAWQDPPIPLSQKTNEGANDFVDKDVHRALFNYLSGYDDAPLAETSIANSLPYKSSYGRNDLGTAFFFPSYANDCPERSVCTPLPNGSASDRVAFNQHCFSPNEKKRTVCATGLKNVPMSWRTVSEKDKRTSGTVDSKTFLTHEFCPEYAATSGGAFLDTYKIEGITTASTTTTTTPTCGDRFSQKADGISLDQCQQLNGEALEASVLPISTTSLLDNAANTVLTTRKPLAERQENRLPGTFMRWLEKRDGQNAFFSQQFSPRCTGSTSPTELPVYSAPPFHFEAPGNKAVVHYNTLASKNLDNLNPTALSFVSSSNSASTFVQQCLG